MRVRNEEAYNARKNQIMEDCFRCYAENGLHRTGMSALAKAAGISKATFYTYFEDSDDLIVQSTAYCMSKVEDDFMALAPTGPDDVLKFIDEVPYWTAQQHGKKYRLMYQVYTHPKFIEAGKRFFEGVDERYTEYAKLLEKKVGIPYQIMTPLIFILVRACVHYALFGDEYYLKTQTDALKKTVRFLLQHKDDGLLQSLRAQD